MKVVQILSRCMLLLAAAAVALPCFAMDVVRDGRPVATIVVEDAGPAAKPSRKRGEPRGDRQAAAVLVEWVRKMTGAELPVSDKAPEAGPAIYVGAAAVKAGLRVDDIASPSREGLRIRLDGRGLLLAGQSDTATTKAACRLLEHWGCRWFIDHPLGEVYPRTKTLAIDKLDVTEKPGFLMRSIWGSQWSGNSLWKTWNGAGGLAMGTAHAWGRYVPRDLFEKHPEYFALRDVQRKAGDWYCTSNPGLREVFAEAVLEHIARGETNPSISPPDGRGYCECDRCRAQDDAKLLEPSSGHVCVTNRYMDFYQDVARRVAKAQPQSVLNFYCYADYTQAPSRRFEAGPNLCAWLAPIRYCRYHAIGQAGCPSRKQLAEQVDGWAAAVSKMGYRTYNYNLAECLVPVSLGSVWKHDIPYLKQKGCIGINLETLPNWQIYAPHIYLSIRLAYDPTADAEAILDDFFTKFYGPKAGPIMKEYWMAIDRACVEMQCHSGGFYAVHRIYTPRFIEDCQERLVQAASATDDPTCQARVQMAAAGLMNAVEYVGIRKAMNRGEFAQAARVYDSLLGRCEHSAQNRLGHPYTLTYLRRFVGPFVTAGVAATAAPSKLVAVLPDRWRMTYDEADEGVAKGYYEPAMDDSAWREMATYGDTLDAQGLTDRLTVLWYRTSFELPEARGKLVLVPLEIDGAAQFYVNGRAVGDVLKARTPGEVDITAAVRPGKNVVAVRVDHSRLTELMLGGILRPVLVVERP